MKGTLHKTDEGWQVSYAIHDMVAKRWTAGKLPLHPEYQTILPLDLDLEGKEVEFDWCVIVEHYTGKGVQYAKLIDSKPERKIDLQNLETKLHQALSEETDESLTEWLESKRQGDVEKLAEKEYPIFDGDLLGIAHNQKHSRIDFIKGYNKAKETLYTEEQVKEPIKKMIKFIDDINDNDRSEFNYYYDHIMDKLKELLESKQD